MHLKNQVAVVTGGGSGLGKGIAVCLAKEGAHVVVSDIDEDSARDVSRQIEKMGQKAMAHKADVRIAQECRHLMAEAVRIMGRIDILVCSAGVSGLDYMKDANATATLEDIPETEWNRTIDINLKGVFFCNQAVAPYFRRQKNGKIINISSTSGRRGVDILPHYCASKAGVILLTQAVALQLAPFHVNANTVCPGKIWTPMWETAARAMSEIQPQLKGKSPRGVFDEMIRATVPLQRPQTPEDVGHAVVFLASSASDNITGQALNVDGGSVLN